MNRPFTHLVIVLPCHSLEDFPTHHKEREADNLLACWTGLWHPALLHSTGRLPDYHPAEYSHPHWLHGGSYFPSENDAGDDWSDNEVDTPDLPLSQSTDDSDSNEELAQHEDDHYPLVVIPDVAQARVDSQFLMEIQQQGVILENISSRDELLRDALEASPPLAAAAQTIDPELAQDFCALGYAYLQVQLMTRQLRYSSNLDENQFSQAVLDAAAAAFAQENEDAKDKLVRCFDILLEEKNAYYPVEPQLCDVLLTAPTTLGKSLQQNLEAAHYPLNLLLTGELATQLATNHTSTAELVRKRIEDGSLTIVGGVQHELPDWLLSTESMIHQVRRGGETFQQQFGVRPRVFMRRRFGLNPSWPGVLARTGFLGAVHATFDGGKFPKSANGVIRWTGDDEQSILTLADVPLDATDSGAFLKLGVKLGEMIDSAHMASALFIHWPGPTCQAFEDLVRITDYSPLFGEFIGLDTFFEQTYDPGYGEQYASDEYQTPYFKQSIANRLVDPVSSICDYWQRNATIDSLRALAAQAISRFSTLDDATDFAHSLEALMSSLDQCQLHFEQAASLIPVGARLDEDGASREGVSRDSVNQLQDLSHAIIHWFASGQLKWPCEKPHGDFRPLLDSASNQARFEDAHSDDQRRQPERQLLIVNTQSSRRRLHVRGQGGDGVESLKNQPPIALASRDQEASHWVFDVPAAAHVTLDEAGMAAGNLFQKDPPIAEELKLQNEFFIAKLDQKTGGIRAVNYHGSRLNLFGQQLAMRIPAPEAKTEKARQAARYSLMSAETISIVESTPLTGAIRSQGKLIDGDQAVADFVQTVRIARGIPRLLFDIQIDLKQSLKPSINHYVCSRIAWKNEGASIVANSLDSCQPVTTPWFHATKFVRIGDEHSLTLLTGGLPFHRRGNRRMLDSLLICAGETRRRFQFAIDIDQNYGQNRSSDWMTLPVVIPVAEMSDAERPMTAGSWCYHLSSKNVQATWWEPFCDSDGNRGVRVRFKETEGRPAKLTFRCSRELARIQETNFLGEMLSLVEVKAEAANQFDTELAPFAHQQYELTFAQ